MSLERFLIYCFLAAPALLIGLLIWAYVHIGLAIIFLAGSFFGAGYAARWIDEAVAREERAQNIMRKWSGPI
jgi:ABC-type dipeptide/oligopeptide/nickel transport system permease subunit